MSLLGSSAWAQNQPSPQFPKRGWAGTVNSAYNSNRVNANWYYTWGRTPHAGSFAEFIPMAWSGIAVSDPVRLAEVTSHSSEWILGFNEPERPEQANMTVDQALALWPILMAASNGKKLVSPNVGSDALGKAWMSEFMTKANQLNAANPGTIRIDAIGMHWYGDVRGTNAWNGLSSQIDFFHDTYTLNGQKLPIWLTEFAGLDFTGGVNPVTQEDNRRFLAGALPMLDAKASLQRYAWFNWRPEAYLGTLPTGMADTPEAAYTLTDAGELYNGRSYTGSSTTYTVVGNEGTDTFYVSGARLQNTAANSTRTLHAIDFIESSSRVEGPLNSNIDVRGGFVRVRSGATLGKWLANTFTMAGIPVYNDGAISGKQGFIVLADGTTVQGSGYIRTEWNADSTPEGIIITESAPGAGGVTINNRIWLNGGQFQVPAGSHTHNGELTLSSNSFANIGGSLTINGPMTGVGTLGKSGTGTLRLNSGLSSNTGAFSVSAGTLIVGNETGSAHGGGTLTIGANGTLAGNGTIGGTSITINGTLAPSKVTDRPRSLNINAPLTFGTGARTMMDVGLIVPDSVISTSSIAFAGTLELVPSILPADLVPMSLFSAQSITGRFASITGVQSTGEANRGLAVLYSPTAVTVTKTILGDTNVDGAVNFVDLLSLARNYGNAGRNWIDGDFSGDGLVDFVDLLALARNYNTSLNAGSPDTFNGPGTGDFEADWALALSMAAVPEPATAALLIASAGLLLRRRR